MSGCLKAKQLTMDAGFDFVADFHLFARYTIPIDLAMLKRSEQRQMRDLLKDLNDTSSSAIRNIVLMSGLCTRLLPITFSTREQWPDLKLHSKICQIRMALFRLENQPSIIQTRC